MTQSPWAVDQIAHYGAYHCNKVNQWIHIVCVPIILWTALAFVGGIDVVEGVSVSYLAAAFYACFYIALDPSVGLAYSVILLAMGITSTQYTREGGSLELAAAIHTICWIFQFIGHGVFEKRAPTLFDSFFAGLLMAPFFTFLEVLFMLGFKKELHLKTIDLAGKLRLEFVKQSSSKSN